MSDPLIRMYGPDDAEAVLALNAENVPEVGRMDMPYLESLAAEAFMLEVVEIDGNIEGAIVVLEEGANYASPNYAWFSQRHDSFVYVDRIMLSELCRGRGIGQQLYELVSHRGRAELKDVMLAEVNTIPENPRSLRFHEVFGFVEIGRERLYGPDEEASMLCKDLGTKPKKSRFKRS